MKDGVSAPQGELPLVKSGQVIQKLWSVLLCIAVYCSAVQLSVLQSGAMQYSTVQCSAELCSNIKCNLVTFKTKGNVTIQPTPGAVMEGDGGYS